MWNKIRLLFRDYRVIPQPAVLTLPKAIQSETHTRMQTKYCKIWGASECFTWILEFSPKLKFLGCKYLHALLVPLCYGKSCFGQAKLLFIQPNIVYPSRQEIYSVCLCFFNDRADILDIQFLLSHNSSERQTSYAAQRMFIRILNREHRIFNSIFKNYNIHFSLKMPLKIIKSIFNFSLILTIHLAVT